MKIKAAKFVINQLVPRLYDSVGNPGEWNPILDELVSAYDFVGASIFSGDEVQIELNDVFMSSAITRQIPAYITNGFNRVDLQSYQCVRDIGQNQSFESEYDLYPRAELSGYTQPDGLLQLRIWLQTIGIEDRLIAVLEAVPGIWSFMVLHCGRRGDLPDPIESATLLKHIARIVRINRPFLLLHNRFNAVFEVIDRFHLGVLVLDSGNRIVLANSAAEQILDDADGIKRSQSGLLKGCLDVSSASLVSAADDLSAAAVEHQSAAVNLSIPRTSGKIDYIAEMSLLSSKVLDSSSDYRLLVITDPERGDIVDLSGIKKIYRLSDAEESVAEKIVVGTQYKDIAAHRGVSPDTVKVQVSSILRKTGCKNRTELVCLAHKATIPVDQVS